eukprot:6213019-Pleurochrysis_carterae.AAC.5
MPPPLLRTPAHAAAATAEGGRNGQLPSQPSSATKSTRTEEVDQLRREVQELTQGRAAAVAEQVSLEGQLLEKERGLGRAEQRRLLDKLKAEQPLLKAPLSLYAFQNSNRLSAKFKTFTSFANVKEFELLFKVLTKWCPVGSIQYWRGAKHAKIAEERQVFEQERQRGHPPALNYIDPFLFTMVQLRCIPYSKACCSLFGISEATGIAYFST